MSRNVNEIEELWKHLQRTIAAKEAQDAAYAAYMEARKNADVTRWAHRYAKTDARIAAASTN